MNNFKIHLFLVVVVISCMTISCVEDNSTSIESRFSSQKRPNPLRPTYKLLEDLVLASAQEEFEILDSLGFYQYTQGQVNYYYCCDTSNVLQNGFLISVYTNSDRYAERKSEFRQRTVDFELPPGSLLFGEQLINTALAEREYKLDLYETSAMMEDGITYLKVYDGPEVADTISLQLEIKEDSVDESHSVTVSLMSISID